MAGRAFQPSSAAQNLSWRSEFDNSRRMCRRTFYQRLSPDVKSSPYALLRCSRRLRPELLRPELREPADCAMRMRKPLVSVELRIRFSHRLEPPVPSEVEMVVYTLEF